MLEIAYRLEEDKTFYMLLLTLSLTLHAWNLLVSRWVIFYLKNHLCKIFWQNTFMLMRVISLINTRNMVDCIMLDIQFFHNFSNMFNGCRTVRNISIKSPYSYLFGQIKWQWFCDKLYCKNGKNSWRNSNTRFLWRPPLIFTRVLLCLYCVLILISKVFSEYWYSTLDTLMNLNLGAVSCMYTIVWF